MNKIKKFVKQLSKFNNFYGFLLKNGEEFNLGNNHNFNCRSLLKKYCIFRRKKGCYYNAQQLAVYSNGKYGYYEGYAIVKKIGIPLEHAWNDRNGKIIDITWKDGVEYYGVNIPYKWLKKQYFKCALDHGVSDSQLRDYWIYKNKNRIMV